MRVAVIDIHGIGQQKEDFGDKFHARLARVVGKLASDVEMKVFPCAWQGVVEPEESRLLMHSSKLRWGLLRRFMLCYAGDALAYQRPSDKLGTYRAIHEVLDRQLAAAAAFLTSPEDRLIIVAHSLGSIIASNFLWDAQHANSSGNLAHTASPEAHKALDHLDTLITLGSPLLVWSLQHPHGGRPIDVDRWLNIFSRHDIIGYPLRPINAHYYGAEIEDRELKAGPWWARWTPMSHVLYHGDKRVVQLVAQEIVRRSSSVR